MALKNNKNEVRVYLRYLRIAPRKVRLVADLIRGKKLTEAQRILNFTVKKAAEPLGKLLKSAIATAEKDFHLIKDHLFISQLLVDEGPKLKRWKPRARGRFYPIAKRTSHITLVLKPLSGKQTVISKKPSEEKDKKNKKK